MFFCEICTLKIQINNRFEKIRRLSEDYIIPQVTTPDLVLEATPEETASEMRLYPDFPEDYHEAVVLFRKLSSSALSFGAFFLHSAAVSLDGAAYLFTGKSGVGKSTHARLWGEVYPRSFIINGDKPLIRRSDKGFYVYGTPWCGKEMEQKNTSAPIKGVCFIEQAQKNSIIRLSPSQVIGKIFNQTVYQKEPLKNEQLLKLLDGFIADIPFFLLKCDVSHEAVRLSHDTMIGDNNGNTF